MFFGVQAWARFRGLTQCCVQEQFGFLKVLQQCLDKKGPEAANKLALTTVARAQRIAALADEWRINKCSKAILPKWGGSVSFIQLAGSGKSLFYVSLPGDRRIVTLSLAPQVCLRSTCETSYFKKYGSLVLGT
jgi:hypothetical protein